MKKPLKRAPKRILRPPRKANNAFLWVFLATVAGVSAILLLRARDNPDTNARVEKLPHDLKKAPDVKVEPIPNANGKIGDFAKAEPVTFSADLMKSLVGTWQCTEDVLGDSYPFVTTGDRLVFTGSEIIIAGRAHKWTRYRRIEGDPLKLSAFKPRQNELPITTDWLYETFSSPKFEYMKVVAFQEENKTVKVKGYFPGTPNPLGTLYVLKKISDSVAADILEEKTGIQERKNRLLEKAFEK